MVSCLDEGEARGKVERHVVSVARGAFLRPIFEWTDGAECFDFFILHSLSPFLTGDR